MGRRLLPVALLLPGAHTVKLVVYDRAGNRSAPVVRRLRIR